MSAVGRYPSSALVFTPPPAWFLAFEPETFSKANAENNEKKQTFAAPPIDSVMVVRLNRAPLPVQASLREIGDVGALGVLCLLKCMVSNQRLFW